MDRIWVNRTELSKYEPDWIWGFKFNKEPIFIYKGPFWPLLRHFIAHSIFIVIVNFRPTYFKPNPYKIL